MIVQYLALDGQSTSSDTTTTIEVMCVINPYIISRVTFTLKDG